MSKKPDLKESKIIAKNRCISLNDIIRVNKKLDNPNFKESNMHKHLLELVNKRKLRVK